jgi:hypothetical protein
MSTMDLLANADFRNGTTGWSSNADYTLGVSESVLRATRNACNGANVQALYPSATLTPVQYAPYVAKFMVAKGRGTYTNGFRADIGSTAGGAEYGTGTTITDSGMAIAAAVATSTTIAPRLVDLDNTGLIAGDYISIPYVSLSRGALADRGTNLLLYSDDLTQSAWTKTRSTITSNTATAPDGTVTADKIVEDTSTNTHYADQEVTVGAAQSSFSFAVVLASSGRNFAAIQLVSSGGSIIAYFNVASGTVGTTFADSGTWTRHERRITSLGSGWYLCVVTGVKLNSDTQVFARIYPASADGTISYTGNVSNGVLAWRATLAQSAVPTRLRQTTSAASAGEAPTGSGLHTKGWPASTNGLLLPDDQIEIVTSRGSELKILTAPVNSDAAGLAYLQFEPPLRGSPADGAAVIVHQPMGRFIYAGESPGWDNEPGYFSQASCQFEEA